MSPLSLSEISEDYLNKQARATENGVMTNVEDITVYPFTEKWWVTFNCGEPFEEYLARIPLGNTREESIQTLNKIYEDFDSLDSLRHSFVEIDLETEHEVQSDSPQAALELEVPVLINSFEGHLCEALRFDEHYIQKEGDIEYIQNKVEDEIILYNSIQRVQEENRELFIKDVRPETESSILLEIGGLDGKTLSVQIELPDYNTIQDSPVSEFINASGSGKIENLEQSPVFLYEKDERDEVIGVDNVFGTYGVSHRKAEPDSSGLLSKFF